MTVRSNPTTFKQLDQAIRLYEAAGRTPSAAFLIWFLVTIYRLDDVEAIDAVCDKSGDAGVDAIWADDSHQEIVLFQAKRKEKLPGTLGDRDLEGFVGALARFKTEAEVRTLSDSTRNLELKALLSNLQIAEKVGKGFTLRPIFIANVAADANAAAYMKSAAAAGVDIDLWDLKRLEPVLKQLARKQWVVENPIALALTPDKFFFQGPRSSPRLVFAAVKAKELVKLPGIVDTRVFAQNVRLGLGRTRVNMEILETIKAKAEHPEFLTFHNGLTIVAREAKLGRQRLHLKGFSVCNGCQSLMALYDNRLMLTDELEILVRVVQVGSDPKIADRIAYRTNNQNPISLRDLKANDTTQVHLKSQFDDLYGKYSTYGIKSGEPAATPELPNEYAGQLVLALYVGQPWSAHQKYKIFDELESQIFGYHTAAPQIRLAQVVAEEADKAKQNVALEKIRKYRLTTFLLVYLVGEMLRTEPDGKRLLENPHPYLSTSAKREPREARIRAALNALAAVAVAELNYYVRDNGDDAYEYKGDFKSPVQVKRIRGEVLKGYEKDKFRGREQAFSLPT